MFLAIIQPSSSRPSAGFALARYNSDGSLDPTFGVQGKVQTQIGPEAWATDLALERSGKIIVAGVAWAIGHQMNALAEELPQYKENVVKKIAELRTAGKPARLLLSTGLSAAHLTNTPTPKPSQHSHPTGAT